MIDFEGSVMQLLPELCSAATRMTGNRADGEDLVSDCVARAWQKRASLRDPAKFRGWIFTILTNEFISQRRLGRLQTESLDAESDDSFSLFEKLHQPFLLWWGNPEQAFLERLLNDDIERAIAELPEEFRAVAVLVDVQGLSYQEVAEALDVPVGTVRSRLARARARLQKALYQHAVDAGFTGTEKQQEGEAS